MTAFVMCKSVSIHKTALSAFVGSVYVCFVYVYNFSGIKNIILKAIIFSLMIFIAFFPKNLFNFLKYMMSFLFINFFLGGCIYFFVSFLSTTEKDGTFYMKTTVMSIILAIALLFIIGRFFIMLFKKNISFEKNKKELTIFYKNRRMKLNTLLDTGNTLIDPISLKSVVVVSPKRIKKLICEDKISSIKNFRLIPCRTVTDKYELLYGFKPDRFLYKDKEIDAVVAISKCEFDGDYDAVINPLTLI